MAKSEHKEGSAEYKGVKPLPVPNVAGYPVTAKTSGIKQRGSGAAKKGFMSRGPMG